jgi:hypothetical protein
MTPQPRIYMAGPDVFQRDYAQHKQQIKQWCAELGLVALCPGDDEVSGDSKAEVARRIYEINMALIDSADYVVANVCDFRGHEPDSGTVFEIGYAVGRGKKVVLQHACAGFAATGAPGRAGCLPCRHVHRGLRTAAQPHAGACRRAGAGRPARLPATGGALARGPALIAAAFPPHC